MAEYQNPKTGELYEVPDEFDPATGKNAARDAAISKGYTPVVTVLDPVNPDKKFTLPDTELQSARDKGYMLPVEFQEQTELDPAWKTTYIPIQSVKGLAAKHGIPFEEADELLEYAGGYPAYREPRVLQALGATADEVILQGLGKFTAKKQMTPEKERLFDDLRNLARKHSSYFREISTAVAAPGLGAAALAKAGATGTKALVAGGAAEGAISGLGVSEQGQELEATALGAGVGAALGGAFAGAAKLLKGVKATDEEIAKYVADSDIGKNLDKRIEAKVAEAPEAYEAVTRNYRTGAVDTPEAAEAIVGRAKKVSADVAEELDVESTQQVAKNFLDMHAIEVASELGFKARKKERPSLSGKVKLAVSEKDAVKRADKARAFLEDVAKRADGEQTIALAERRVRDRFIVAKELEKDARKAVGLTGTKGIIGRIGDFLMDGKYVARGIDRRLGTDVEGVLGIDMPKAYTALSRYEAVYGAEISNLRKEISKLNLSEEDFTKLIESKESLDKASQEIQSVGRQALELFEQMRLSVAGEGLNIAKLKSDTLNYVPAYKKGNEDIVILLENRTKELSEKFGVDFRRADLPQEEFQKYMDLSPEFNELVRSVEVFNTTKIASQKQLRQQLALALTPGKRLGTMQDTVASAAFMREGEIPELIRERNFTRLALRWMTQSHRHALFQKNIAELARYRDLAAASRDARAEKWLNNLLDDLTGVREGTPAARGAEAKQALQRTLYKQSKEAKSPLTRAINRALLESTEMSSAFMQMPYASWLGGLKVKSLLTNLTQTVTFTFPELGPRLGTRVGLATTGDIASLLARGETITIKSSEVLARIKQEPKLAAVYGDLKLGDEITTKNISLILANERLLGQSWNHEMLEAMREGLLSAPGGAKARAFIQKYSDFMLAAYQRTEWINRYVAYRAGGRLADLVAEGDKATLKYLSSDVPTSIRRRLLDAINAGDMDAAREVGRNWLIDTTILNYTRSSLSEYGRTMGPLFSMFTKWPTTIGADIVDTYVRKGVTDATMRVALKYMAPWATFAAAGAWATSEIGENRNRVLFGAGGLQGSAPVGSAKDFFTGAFFQAPALDVISSLGRSVENPEKFPAWLDRQVMTFVPGAVLLEQLTSDMPALFYDDPRTPLKPVTGPLKD